MVGYHRLIRVSSSTYIVTTLCHIGRILYNFVISVGMQPSLQGVKVPDENLTPQQRQHREEQLATIRKLTKMFCLEGQGQPGGKPGMFKYLSI